MKVAYQTSIGQYELAIVEIKYFKVGVHTKGSVNKILTQNGGNFETHVE